MKRFLLAALLAFGCDESVDTAPDPLRGLPALDGGSLDGASIDGASMDSDVEDAAIDSATVDAPSGSGALVINEVQASGDDWIEIRNVGREPLDVGGFVVTQTDDLGMPEPERSPAFPAGYVLPAGGYFIVLAGREVMDGVQTDCVLPGVFQCLIAEFGISAGSGDTLVIVDAGGGVIESMVYPGDAAEAEDTFARLPDGEGDFGVARPTPLAPNVSR
ncbi:MAG: lamin tail domain-containing protein [Myxococcota bacterium]